MAVGLAKQAALTGCTVDYASLGLLLLAVKLGCRERMEELDLFS
jgi:hypothetical protein